MTFSILTFSIEGLYEAFSRNDIEQNNTLDHAECRYAECRVLFIVILSVIMLNVIMLSIIMVIVMVPFTCTAIIEFDREKYFL